MLLLGGEAWAAAPGAAVRPKAPKSSEPTEMRSPALVITGVVMVGLGAAAGVYRETTKLDPNDPCIRSDQCSSHAGPYKLLAPAAVVLFLGGASLIFVGAWPVPAKKRQALVATPWATARAGGLAVRLEL